MFYDNIIAHDGLMTLTQIHLILNLLKNCCHASKFPVKCNISPEFEDLAKSSATVSEIYSDNSNKALFILN